MLEIVMPRGFRFRPEKEEIFFYYLYPFINGNSILYAFEEVDMYGENKEPWNLFKLNEDSPESESFWVFTRLRKKSEFKIDRIAGCGCWSNKDKRTDVRDSKGRLLGYEKYYIFTNTGKKNNKDDHLKWMMHEYSVEGSNNLVFCEIKYELVGNKKRKSSSSTIDHANDESSISPVKKICLGSHNTHQLANQESDQENKNPVPIMVINTHSHENRDGSVLLNFNDHGVVVEDLPHAD
ncbi:No apical meristem (NAM) protein [Corchorus olitorius]|uniref:No apical meristem (NAM) protein n=1 Tax=Corchorus olitorius TaxID=93759 RepID=A0A1R3JUW6_9ROSI|nr:No apical meristem (NAM) protein [Corchorus olitorius]